MSIERITNELETHFEEYDDRLIEKIINIVSLDNKYSVHIKPKISLNDNPSNLHFANKKQYRQFVRKMRRHGLFVHSNIDAYKVAKLGTLNQMTRSSNDQLLKTQHVPDLEELCFSKYSMFYRYGNDLVNLLFHHMYLKYH